MKFNRKLLAAVLVVCMMLSTLLPAAAAPLNATYGEASYYDIATTAYSRMLLFQNGDGVVAAANQNQKYGLVNVTGGVVVPFQYDGLELLGSGLFKATDANGKCGIINAAGAVVYPFQAADVTVNNGVLRVVDFDENGWWGESKYFTLTMQPSTEDQYWGRAEEDEIPASLAQYEDVWLQWDGYYHIGAGGLADPQGKVIFAPGEYEAVEVCATEEGEVAFLVSRPIGGDNTWEQEYAVLNAEKQVVVPFGTYESIHQDWSSGVGAFQVSKDGQEGMIDFQGKVLVPLGDYQELGGVNGQGYVSAYNGTDSTIYRNGQVAATFPGQHITTRFYYRDLAFSLEGQDEYNHSGMMDINGKVIIPAEYWSIGAVDANGNMTVIKMKDAESWEEVFGLYGADGTHIFQDQYSSLYLLSGTKYKVCDGTHYGVLSSATTDPAKQVVIPLKYEDLRVYTEHFVWVYDGTNYSVLDLENKEVIPASSEAIYLFNARMDGEYWDYWYPLENDLWHADWYAEEYDGYTDTIQPFVLHTADGGVSTHYVDYYSGTDYGTLPYAASNINGSGWFVYQDPKTGLYGFGHTDEATWSNDGSVVGALAYASTQTVLVDGEPVVFNAYALKDANGNDTNYVKLRDVAQVLNGSAAQFQVGWDGSIAITTQTAYTPDGSELVQNFTGNQSYTVSTSPVTVNGKATNLEAIILTDASGGGYTYFKLRDLGTALNFKVDWTAETGIFIETK